MGGQGECKVAAVNSGSVQTVWPAGAPNYTTCRSDHIRPSLVVMKTKPVCWHIVSYPRSGNHAVRALLELFAQRPTLGCPGSDVDIPIYQREANQRQRLIAISNSQPIGRKSHSLADMHLHLKDTSALSAGVILITRDPAEAIMSHLYPEYAAWHHRQKKLSKNSFSRLFRKNQVSKNWKEAVRWEVSLYLESIYMFLCASAQTRLHLHFEDLIQDRLSFARNLSEQIGLPGPHSEATVLSVLQLSQESLVRSGNHLRNPKMVEELQAMIIGFLTYDEVRKILENR